MKDSSIPIQNTDGTTAVPAASAAATRRDPSTTRVSRPRDTAVRDEGVTDSQYFVQPGTDMGRKTQCTPNPTRHPVNRTPSPDDEFETDEALDRAFRRRRQQRLGNRSEPGDAASGTARISARLAEARLDALTTPRQPLRAPEVIDLRRSPFDN